MDVDRCLAIGSVSAALAFAMVRTSKPGDGIVRLRPTYPPLVDAIAASDRVDRPVDLVRGTDVWELDLDAFEAACREARLLLWVAPHNPTGRVWREDEVAAVAEIAARHGLVVLSDEIWGDVLLHGARHVPFEPVAREIDWQLMERTLTVVGTSKAWNLSDLGAAVLHTDSEELWRRLHGPGHVPLLARPGRPALRAGLAAWREGRGWLEDTLATLETTVDHAVGSWQRAFGSHRVTRPEGTYLVWLDLRGLVPDDDPMSVLAVPDGVVPSDGTSFGAPGFVRCNLATTIEEAAEIVARVTALVDGAA
jgi:cystathionine beta-lyase